jgi:hypothetical protein
MRHPDRWVTVWFALCLHLTLPAAAAPSLPNPPLVKEDHTRILYVVVADLAALRKKVDVQRMSGSDELRAAQQLETTDSFTRVRIERVLQFLPALEQALSRVSAEERSAIDEIGGRLAASTSVTSRLSLLAALDEETLPNGRYVKFSGVNSGLLAATRCAEDGLTTVYSVDWVYTCLRDSRTRMLIHAEQTTGIGGGESGDFASIWSVVKGMFDAGTRGALSGAASYYANRLPDTTPGECALAFAIGASARELVSHVD